VVGAILRKLSMQDVSPASAPSPSMAGPLVNLTRGDSSITSGLANVTSAATTGSSSVSPPAVPRDGSLASLLNNDTTTAASHTSTSSGNPLMTPPLSTPPVMTGNEGNNSISYPTTITTSSSAYGASGGLGLGNNHLLPQGMFLPAGVDLSQLDFGDPGLLPLDDVLSNPSLVDWVCRSLLLTICFAPRANNAVAREQAFIDQILLDNPEGGFRALQ